MVKLKKYSVHKAICDTCKGNGYVKVVHIDEEEHVHQCWDCDSEGEFYVHEPEMVSSSNDDNDSSGDDVAMH